MKLSAAQRWVLEEINAGDTLAFTLIGNKPPRRMVVWWRFEPGEPRPRVTTICALLRKQTIEPVNLEHFEGEKTVELSSIRAMQLTPAGRAALGDEDV